MRKPRLFWWQIATLVLFVAVLFLRPQDVPLTLYKLSLLTLAVLLAYWADRELFPYARPDQFMALPFSPGSPYVPERSVPVELRIVFAAAMLRRAIIIGACVVAVALAC